MQPLEIDFLAVAVVVAVGIVLAAAVRIVAAYAVHRMRKRTQEILKSCESSVLAGFPRKEAESKANE